MFYACYRVLIWVVEIDGSREEDTARLIMCFPQQSSRFIQAHILLSAQPVIIARGPWNPLISPEDPV